MASPRCASSLSYTSASSGTERRLIFDMLSFSSASSASFALSILFISTLTLAQANTAFVPAASTFYIPETETQFSVNVANDSSDVYLYFSSPADSWVGVGFGTHMRDSLMLIMYPDADGTSTYKFSNHSRICPSANAFRCDRVPTYRQKRR